MRVQCNVAISEFNGRRVARGEHEKGRIRKIVFPSSNILDKLD